MNSLVASGPIYNHKAWIKPPDPEPTTYLCKAPDKS